MSQSDRWIISKESAELEHGLRLQGELTLATSRIQADPASLPSRLVILLHPYAPLGGTMSDHVIKALVDALTNENYLTQAGQDIAVLRYNARGVRSRGKTSWKGLEEVHDLEDWVDWSIKRLQWDQKDRTYKIYIIGYSYGALAASCFRTSEDQQKLSIDIAYALISYPLSYLPLLTTFHTAPFRDALKSYGAGTHLLLVYTTEDNFTSAGRYHAWSNSIKDHRPIGKVQIEVFDDNHFWVSCRPQLVQAVVNWVSSH